MQPVIIRAFQSGLLCAASMPLGAVTSRFWQPSGRVVGALTAFGAGALLAATMLDLVSHAVEEGFIVELVTGGIIGSLFFTTVNQFMNKYGSFLRKPATAAAHIANHQEQHFQDLLKQVRRLEIFRSLTPHALKRLTKCLLVSHYSSNTVLYQPGSACETLYILNSGNVQLLDPDQDMQPFAQLKRGDIFSRMAFFTGAPHGTVAIATTDCEIASLPRESFEDLLETCPELNEATQHLVQGDEIAQYLLQRHHLTRNEIKAWVEKTVTCLQTAARIPDAVSIDNKANEFIQIARQIKRLPIFQYLLSEDIEAIASRLQYRRVGAGQTFFYQGEEGQTLYIIHAGHVLQSDPKSPSRKAIRLHPKDAFGELSFLTGARHTVTAVADSSVCLWQLSKTDFEELLKQSLNVNHAVETFLRQGEITGYLQQKQNFSQKQSTAWLQQAFNDLQGGETLPSAQAMIHSLGEHNNAPLAIWLGLLIDGIPESLTIGAGTLVSGGVSATLLAGLFISNYPEALSSSDGMRQQGFPFTRIVTMWVSVMLIQGIVAGLGSLLLAGASENLASFIESIGAGAILTVLAETMLPEAYMRRGYFIGLSLLLGFLVIVLIKTFL
ncbi:cyclic nucleotide-binding domain-containing protein [Leptothoe sp. LEGE 181152]|nr:cyclic nucleotide-binding domain-containing protein [Leptothoe sp. LEGE 181152]